MKIVGCILVVIICMLIGRTMAGSYIERVKSIKEFITALSLLRSKIAFGQEVLEVSFLDIAIACENRVGKIFGNIADILKNTNIPISEVWRDKIEDSFVSLDLNFEDERILLDFGYSLGKGSIDEEIRNINLACERLKTQLESATIDRDKYAKLYKVIGGIGGMALAVVLI